MTANSLIDETFDELKKIKDGIDSSLERDKEILLIQDYKTKIISLTDFLPEGLKNS